MKVNQFPVLALKICSIQKNEKANSKKPSIQVMNAQKKEESSFSEDQIYCPVPDSSSNDENISSKKEQVAISKSSEIPDQWPAKGNLKEDSHSQIAAQVVLQIQIGRMNNLHKRNKASTNSPLKHRIQVLVWILRTQFQNKTSSH